MALRITNPMREALLGCLRDVRRRCPGVPDYAIQITAERAIQSDGFLGLFHKEVLTILGDRHPWRPELPGTEQPPGGYVLPSPTATSLTGVSDRP
jgi:hypothetical protein